MMLSLPLLLLLLTAAASAILPTVYQLCHCRIVNATATGADITGRRWTSLIWRLMGPPSKQKPQRDDPTTGSGRRAALRPARG